MSITTDDQLEYVANRIMEYENNLEQRIVDHERGEELVKLLNNKMSPKLRNNYVYAWDPVRGLTRMVKKFDDTVSHIDFYFTPCNHLLALDTNYDWSRFINKEKNNNV